jgi:small-conductance mechanosensitive channel
MKYFFEQIATLPLAAKLLAAILGILLIRGAFRFLGRTLPLHFGHGDVRYRVRKLVTLAGYLVVLAFVTVLFEDRLRRVGFGIGLFGAGVVVALQDMIASIGGWFAIGFSNLYRVGDRIQVGDTKGDVIDISVLRTTVMETGNWVSGDLYNGRVVRIPNSSVLKGLVFNYSQGFRFVWDEIKAHLTSESDHVRAREMLLRVAKGTVTDYLVEAQTSWKKIAENFRLENPSLEPTVTLVVSGGSLEFSLSYIVDYTKRTMVKDQLFTKIVDEVANSDGRLEWASSSTTVNIQPVSTDLQRPARPLSSATGELAR